VSVCTYHEHGPARAGAERDEVPELAVRCRVCVCVWLSAAVCVCTRAYACEGVDSFEVRMANKLRMLFTE
jgi:hypothetical protein